MTMECETSFAESPAAPISRSISSRSLFVWNRARLRVMHRSSRLEWGSFWVMWGSFGRNKAVSGRFRVLLRTCRICSSKKSPTKTLRLYKSLLHSSQSKTLRLHKSLLRSSPSRTRVFCVPAESPAARGCLHSRAR